MLNEKQQRELLGLSLLALALFTALSLVPPGWLGAAGARPFPSGNLMGVVGRLVARGGFRFFGAGMPLVPVLPLLGGLAAFGVLSMSAALRGIALLAGLLVLIPTTTALFTPLTGSGAWAAFPGTAAGWLGATLGVPLVALLGPVGAGLAVLFAGVALPVATVGWNPLRAAGGLGRRVWAGVRGARSAGGVVTPPAGPEPEEGGAEGGARDHGEPDVAFAGDPGPWSAVEEDVDPFGDLAPATVAAVDAAEPAGVKRADRKATREAKKGKSVAKAAPEVPVFDDPGDPESGDLPPIGLLTAPPGRDASLSEKELDRLGQVLIDTLKTFKVEGQIGGRTTGPVVTQFEVVPAPGVKVNKIAALDADLALALRAPSVRIVAPIPGKGAVGVEVPNPTPEVVYLREILESPAFARAKGALPLALGKDLTGKPYVTDLARTPHLLIAGATGSGKSVCVNTIITSLIYKHSPRTLRLLMVDPKMVELSMYGDLPHLRHPVVTDPNDAAIVLKWAVLEMERRYALLSVNGVRSLAEFNRRVEEGVPLRRPEAEGDEGDPDRWLYQDGPLPYIVVVVDELADLMMAVQSEIEKPLAQLAQKARAIGIHLIVATQRPSVNVITGLIKANFPSRIAFRVSSKVDSRTILDQNGADALLGNGDMLFLPPGTSDPVRIQGAFLATEDTERLMAWYREMQRERPAEEEDILEVVRAREAEAAGEETGDEAPEDRDPLFRQAAEVCIQFQQGSTSLLQRRLRIGYGRAARIIDQLHHAGILGPPDGSKPREVLVGMESLDHICGED